MSMIEETLGDIGERRIVREVLPNYCSPVGDDCAAFVTPPGTLVITTDPVPEPAAKVIGNDPDTYWMGWLLVTINCSDIAAAGATPCAFVAAIEAPAATRLRDFERFLGGIKEACCAHGIAYVGGNLREGPRLTAIGTAVGVVQSGRPLTRTGAKIGDVVVSVGMGGVFWRDAFSILRGTSVQKEASPVFRPVAQIEAMAVLRENNLTSAAIDNSDGLLPTLEQLAIGNNVGIEVETRPLRESRLASAYGSVDAARCWLGWGDWNVICAIPDDRMSDAIRLTKSNGHTLIPIGRVVERQPGAEFVTIVGQRERLPAPRVESERFSKDSWFSAGIEAYIKMLESAKLPD